jgi:positive regulator of sigma E activity
MGVKEAPMLKPSLIMTALAPVVFVVSVVLHNLISAWLGVEEPVFFVVAVVVAPLAFTIGLLATAVALVTERRGGRPAPR